MNVFHSKFFVGSRMNRLFAMVAICVCAWKSSVLASGSEVSLSAADLRLQVDSRWTGCLYGGYYPVRISVINAGPPRNLTFEVTGDDLPKVTKTVGVEQNATVRFSLSIPLVGSSYYGTLKVKYRGQEIEGLTSSLDLPEQGYGDFDRPSLLVISQDHVACKEFENAINGIIATRSRHSGYYGWGGGHVTENHQVIPPVNLPQKWIDYSGIDLLAIPLNTLARLSRGEREAILKWTQTGGNLIVYDIGKPIRESKDLPRLLEFDKLSAISTEWAKAEAGGQHHFLQSILSILRNTGEHGPHMEPAMESIEAFLNLPAPLRNTILQQFGLDSGYLQEGIDVDTLRERFRELQILAQGTAPGAIDWDDIAPEMKPKWDLDKSFAVREVMLGHVYAFSGNPFHGSSVDWVWLLEMISPNHYQWTKRHGISARHSDENFLEFRNPTVKSIPPFAFVLLITVFTIVIGPVNYYFLARRKQLYALLVTIPAIACVTSVLLISYSVFNHGFGVKSRIRSMTILDQEAKTSVTLSRVALHAGLTPSDGLVFSPETAVLPLWPDGRGFESGHIDWTETQAMRAGFLPSRTRTQFLTISHQPSRGRLNVGAKVNSGREVSNGLEYDLQHLIVVDESGSMFHGSEIAAGQNVTLKPATRNELAAIEKLLKEQKLEMPEDTRRNSDFGIMSGMSYPGYYDYGQTANYNMNMAERRLMGVSVLAGAPQKETTRWPLREKSYFAILKGNPDIDKGVEKTKTTNDLHTLLGYY